MAVKVEDFPVGSDIYVYAKMFGPEHAKQFLKLFRKESIYVPGRTNHKMKHLPTLGIEPQNISTSKVRKKTAS